MAKLQNSAPQEYHLGEGFGFDIPAKTSDYFIVPRATPSHPSSDYISESKKSINDFNFEGGTLQTESLHGNLPQTQE